MKRIGRSATPVLRFPTSSASASLSVAAGPEFQPISAWPRVPTAFTKWRLTSLLSGTKGLGSSSAGKGCFIEERLVE
ncbi:hypothetical protein BDW66DRAFT_48339 [Aspergillus desertorum]